MNKFISVLATVLPLAAAAPFEVLQPRQINDGGCGARSSNFTWDIVNFDFHSSHVSTTPATDNSTGTINFSITNPAVNVVTNCTATSDHPQDFFYGNVTYTCTSSDPVGGTTFDFNRATGTLDVNQTWICREIDPPPPQPNEPFVSNDATYTAYGKVNLDLKCRRTKTLTPGLRKWRFGKIYSESVSQCDFVSLSLKPYLMEAVM